ncbi:uncharacterized protein LOC128274484 isoform X1 [Anopheles cruzii]|uniref:uncharacterized protein LOC128274484 isoform X1 n=1 Tax=Anopheles cruzii TaxID=68878 RepID=UPI0022EC4537|nr:uncharacterized protein LOC128274484 isoform X1 [Anopheles cruzii]XP_052868672.1 uncharacterized protein LOC128274484 isoform X1 [Anopheles cruzii]XP_052868688.1 uncharacterized protein LOC128274484 isoform X1 [Anopheles cruzii]
MQLSKILSLAALVLGCVVLGSRADPQANQAAADPSKANRNSLLLRRNNVGRPLGRTTATTTTTTTASPDYAEDEYADNYDEGKGDQGDGGEEDAADGGGGGKQATTTTTTTEAPKKIRPSIRPFRSNDDLLSALKKRREESKNSKPAAALPKEKVYDGDEAPAVAAAPIAKPAKAPAIGKIADNIVFSFTKPSNKRRFGNGATGRKDTAGEPASGDTAHGQGPDQGDDGSSSGGGSAASKSLIGRLGRSRFALKQ